MSPKKRIPIEPQVAAEIMFAADRTCCICRIRGRPVQIHHIDEDILNNDPANLVVLCLDCHNEIQVEGGFGRRLDAPQVRHFREDWLARVRSRRDRADALAVEVMGVHGTTGRTTRPAKRPDIPLTDYIRTLPELRRRAYAAAQPSWDSGVTADMVNAGYAVVEILEDILVSLATYYPEGHFDRENPRDYFSELIASRFRWHRYHIETAGKGRSGTIVGPIVVGAVIDDLEEMVVDMVTSLTLDWEASTDTEIERWKREWKVGGGDGVDRS